MALLAIVAAPWASLAEDKLPRNIRILIGYPPGGGHDIEGRVIARYLGKYLPSNPKILVQNMPGAGGMIMAGYVFNRAKPNGSVIGLFGSSHGIQALLYDSKDIKYDMSKMPIIWAVSGVYIDIVREFLGAKTAKDLLKVNPQKIVVAGRSKAGSSCLKGQLALRLLGVEGYTPVCAYAGTAVIKAAMERGEASFFNASDAHLMGSGAFVDLHKRGLVFPLWQAGKVKNGKIVRSNTVDPNVPTFAEVYESVHGKPPSGMEWEAWKALSLDITRLTRILVLPPGTPKGVVTQLRQGIERMAQDPKFVSDWERVFGMEFGPVRVPADEAEKIRDEVMSPSPWQEYLRKFAS